MNCPCCGERVEVPAAELGRLFRDWECACGAAWRSDRSGRVLRRFQEFDAAELEAVE